jgi:hypothetical protein
VFIGVQDAVNLSRNRVVVFEHHESRRRRMLLFGLGTPMPDASLRLIALD